jgi:hypothetical protein
VKLPRDYPGPERVTALCAQLRILDVWVPSLQGTPYHEAHWVQQKAHWNEFSRYVLNFVGGEIELDVPEPNNQQEIVR